MLPLSLRGATVPALLATLALLAVPVASAQDLTDNSNGEVPVAGRRQLTAYAPLVINTVTWDVNGVAGGNSVWGTVSAKGLYAAPAGVPTANAVKVRATSSSQPSLSAALTLTITQVPPRLWGVSPRAFTLSLNGLYFTANAVVRLDGVALPTTPVAATQLTATGATSAAQKGKDVPALIGQAGVGGVTSGTVTVRVMAETPTPTPGPGLDTADLKAGRWLEQAAFGPTRRRWRGSS